MSHSPSGQEHLLQDERTRTSCTETRCSKLRTERSVPSITAHPVSAGTLVAEDYCRCMSAAIHVGTFSKGIDMNNHPIRETTPGKPCRPPHEDTNREGDILSDASDGSKSEADGNHDPTSRPVGRKAAERGSRPGPAPDDPVSS